MHTIIRMRNSRPIAFAQAMSHLAALTCQFGRRCHACQHWLIVMLMPKPKLALEYTLREVKDRGEKIGQLIVLKVSLLCLRLVYCA